EGEDPVVTRPVSIPILEAGRLPAGCCSLAGCCPEAGFVRRSGAVLHPSSTTTAGIHTRERPFTRRCTVTSCLNCPDAKGTRPLNLDPSYTAHDIGWEWHCATDAKSHFRH